MFFDTGSGNKRKLLNITKIATELGEQCCGALLGLHAFTGCDATSTFKGIGKLKPLKLMQKTSKYENACGSLGESWTVSQDLMNDLESFTCGFYSNSKISSVDVYNWQI